jgi:hypothetical protein
LLTEPSSDLRAATVIERQHIHSIGARVFQNCERQIGHFQPKQRSIRQRMGDEASEHIVPSEIRMAVVWPGRNLSESRPREPLRGRMGLDPSRT